MVTAIEADQSPPADRERSSGFQKARALGVRALLPFQAARANHGTTQRRSVGEGQRVRRRACSSFFPVSIRVPMRLIARPRRGVAGNSESGSHPRFSHYRFPNRRRRASDPGSVAGIAKQKFAADEPADSTKTARGVPRQALESRTRQVVPDFPRSELSLFALGPKGGNRAGGRFRRRVGSNW